MEENIWFHQRVNTHTHTYRVCLPRRSALVLPGYALVVSRSQTYKCKYVPRSRVSRDVGYNRQKLSAAVVMSIKRTLRRGSGGCKTKIRSFICYRATSGAFFPASLTSSIPPHQAAKESGSSSWDKGPRSRACGRTLKDAHTYTRALRVRCHTPLINSYLSAGSPYRICPPKGDSFPMTDKGSLGDIEDP